MRSPDDLRRAAKHRADMATYAAPREALPNGATFRACRLTRSASAHAYAVRWWGEFVGTVDPPRHTGRPGWTFARAGAPWVPIHARAVYPTRAAATAGLLRDAGMIR
jgi:hypothetical protein